MIDAVLNVLETATPEAGTSLDHIDQLRSVLSSSERRPGTVTEPTPPPPVLGSFAGTSELADAAIAVADGLSWSNAARFWGDQLGESGTRMWFGEVVSPNPAPQHAGDAYIVALQVHDENTVYPLHAHPIDETYLVVAGTGEWMLDDEDWKPIEPGTAIHISPFRPHGMHCGHEPMLLVSVFVPPLGFEGARLI